MFCVKVNYRYVHSKCNSLNYTNIVGQSEVHIRTCDMKILELLSDMSYIQYIICYTKQRINHVIDMYHVVSLA